MTEPNPLHGAIDETQPHSTTEGGVSEKPTMREALEGLVSAVSPLMSFQYDWGAVAKALRVARAALAAEEESGWLPIEAAKKDQTPIWAAIRADLVAFTGRADLDRWAGRQVPLHHPGLAEDGFDVGWVVSAPVGHCGFPNSWIAGWRPLPASPSSKDEP